MGMDIMSRKNTYIQWVLKCFLSGGFFLLWMNMLMYVCVCLCRSAAAFAHLTVTAPHQFHFSIGLALELQLGSRPSPTQASTRSSAGRLSANTQTQLSIVSPVVLCRLTHLQESNQSKARIGLRLYQSTLTLFETKQMLAIFSLLGSAFVCVYVLI